MNMERPVGTIGPKNGKQAAVVEHCVYEIATGRWPASHKMLSVREAEALVKKPARPKAATVRVDPDVRALEERISRALGTRVGLKTGRKKGSGQLIVRYDSFDDLDRILLLLEK